MHESRQDYIRLALLTRKCSRPAQVRRWTAHSICAIIAQCKQNAHNAAPQWCASRKEAAGARNCRLSRSPPMQKDASVRTACVPRSQNYRSSTKERKREASVDLNRGTSGCAHFSEAIHNSTRHGVQTFRASALFAKRGNRLAGIAADSNARINFNFAQHGHTVSQRGFRAFAVAKNINRLAAVRARERAHVLDHAEHFYIHLAEHFDGLTHIRKRDS